MQKYPDTSMFAVGEHVHDVFEGNGHIVQIWETGYLDIREDNSMYTWQSPVQQVKKLEENS